MEWIISLLIMLVHVFINIGGVGMECARQRYNLGHFISPVIGCVEKCLTGFMIDDRTIKRVSLFAYRSSSATRVI